MYDDIIQFLRKLCILWQVHKWTREAQHALRGLNNYQARIALERVDMYTKML